MIPDSLVRQFKTIVGDDNAWTDAADLHTYSYDAAVVDPVQPGLIARPTTIEALGKTVRLCNDNGLPLTVRGAGTNLSGGTVPLPGGVVIVTNGMKSIIEINEADMYAVVQPGVVTAKLAAAVEAKGL
ncbi:MAG: FAD-binding oxidoreductase, partial [Desulfobacteraceae bacterium]|nr:FAD-binding oxidoreductase [Desulfobacteraceae bacterium]